MAAPKWQKLKGKLPEAPAADMTSVGAEPTFLEQVDEQRRTFAGTPLKTLMEWYTECNEEWDSLEERKKELNVQFEALGQLIKDKFEEQNVNSVQTEDGETFKLHVEPYISVIDREALHQWVDAHEDLQYLWSVHPQSLASLVKSHLENGEDDQIPPCVKVFLKTQVRVRKG